MKQLLENWRLFLTEVESSTTYYHGTTFKAAEQIIQKGFDFQLSGARQKALHDGTDQAEVRGVYLTPNKRLAEWYAGGLTTPGRGGGAVVETTVSGRLMSSDDWWRMRASMRKEWGLGLWDSRRFEFIKEVVKKAKKAGFTGFVENVTPEEEVIVFDPRNVNISGAYEVGTNELITISSSAM